MVKLLKHHQTAHFTCTMCPGEKWVGLSNEHLNIHQKHTHKVRVTKQKCEKCKLVFPDAMAKEHNCKCTNCNKQFDEKKNFEVHMETQDQVRIQKKNMKCIVCEFRAVAESELTKHYESKHINENNKQSSKANILKCIKCKESFTEKKYLDAHVKSYHQVPGKEHKCKVCNQTLRSEAELTKHYEDEHINSNGASSKSPQSKKKKVQKWSDM